MEPINRQVLLRHQIICTSTTGLGAMIAEGKIDLLIFFWDPMQPQPHAVDVKALLRIAVLYNIPCACNRATADFLISFHLINERYVPMVRAYTDYLQRRRDMERCDRVPELHFTQEFPSIYLPEASEQPLVKETP